MRHKSMLSLSILLLLFFSMLPASLAPAPAAQATAYHAITIDGDMSDWAADEFMELDGTYGLYLTWDASNLYLGLTGATLGDTSGQDKSFFVCFDTDLTPGSGAPADGYSTVTFNTATFAPEYCYYFAGAAGWYEWAFWNPLGHWVWQPWRDDGTYYNWPGNPAPFPGSEVTIIRSEIGNPTQVRVVAWLTPEESSTVEASWPTSNPVGSGPTLRLFYHLPSLTDGFSPNRSVLAGHIVINEFAPKGTEWVELYNPTESPVSLAGWYVDDANCGTGTSLIGAVTLDPGATYVVDTNQPGDNFDLDNGGDIVVLCDAAHTEIDRSAYGYIGGAPISHSQTGISNSTARTPNGTDTDDHARDWNVATTPTKNAPNTAPAVLLGSSLTINEVEYGGANSSSRVEIFNPTDQPIELNGWLFSDGDRPPWAFVTSTVTLPAGGFYVFAYSDLSGSGIGGTDVSYLFTPTGVRVDQLGWNGVTLVNSAQRICDGDGPNDGYNWVTSGGGVTLQDLPRTYGQPNCLPDVTIDKAGPAYVGASGGNIDYALTYHMASGFGQSIIITDTLPASVTYVSFDSILPVTLTNVDPVVFDAGALPYGAVNVITLTAHVLPDLPFGTRLTNTVEIACSGDTNPANNEDEWTTIVVGSETAIAKAGPALALPGQTIAYTLTYVVEGDAAVGVVITDTLPGDVTYISDTAPVPPSEPTPGTWVWNLGTVVPGTHSFLVYAAVAATPLARTLHNEAQVYAENDTDPDNNWAALDTELPLPIYEIQHVNVITGTSPSPYLGQHVYVLGVVVAGSWVYPSGAGNPVRYVLADPYNYGPWQGLFVYDTRHVVTESQLLLLGGTVAEYNGMTELNVAAGDYFQVLDQNWPVPAPILTTTAAITTPNPQTAEPLESVLVEVACAEVTRLPNQYGEWLVTDWSGLAAQVDDLGDYSYVPQLGDVLNVRGVLFYSYSHYKIEPRGDGDIVQVLGVVGTAPPDGAIDVPVDVSVQATFNMSLTAATINPATFFLEGPGGVVPASVLYTPGSTVATLDPTDDLAYGTTYIAHLTTEIESFQGTPLCAEYTWSFTTASAPEPDLTPSIKAADRFYVYPGEVLTFTIHLINVGEIEALTTITDVLPAGVSVLTGTLPPGMVYSDGLLLWGGVVPAGAHLPLPFQARVLDVPPTVVTNLVWIDDGVHAPFTRTTSVEVLGAPDIEVSPLALSVVLNPGGTASRLLTIRNMGQEVLDWGLSEMPAVPWLAETPTGGVIQPTGQETVQVAFDATGVVTGTYTTTLDIASNDPDEPHVWVDVTLVVTSACIPITGTDLIYAPPQPHPWQVITFTGSVDHGSEPITYTWYFGDGFTATGRVVTHTYTISNTYAVTLTVENPCSQQTIRKAIRVVWPHVIYLPVIFRGANP